MTGSTICWHIFKTMPNEVIIILLLCLAAETLVMRYFWLRSEKAEKEVKRLREKYGEE